MIPDVRDIMTTNISRTQVKHAVAPDTSASSGNLIRRRAPALGVAKQRCRWLFRGKIAFRGVTPLYF